MMISLSHIVRLGALNVREIKIRDLRRNASVDWLHAVLPCLIVADGIAVCAIVSAHDVALREREPATSGDGGAHDDAHRAIRGASCAELPLSKQSQAVGHSYRPGYGRGMP